MKRHSQLNRVLGILLTAALIFTSAPLSGFLGIDLFGSAIWAKAQEQGDVVYLNDEAVNYAAGVRQTDLRMPVLEQAADEPAPGKLVEVEEYAKTYQTGERAYQTIFTEIPNLYYDEKGQAQSYDNTLELEHKALSADYYSVKSSDIDARISTEMLEKGVTFTYDGVTVTLVPQEGDYSRSAAAGKAIFVFRTVLSTETLLIFHALDICRRNSACSKS